MGAFNHILNDLTVIVNQFEQLSSFSAGIERLSSFLTAMRDADPTRDNNEGLLALHAESNTTLSLEIETNELSSKQSASSEQDTDNGLQTTIQLNFASMSDTKSILNVNRLQLMTPDNKRTLIKDLNLTVEKGENLLIVGSSGAGT